MEVIYLSGWICCIYCQFRCIEQKNEMRRIVEVLHLYEALNILPLKPDCYILHNRISLLYYVRCRKSYCYEWEQYA